MVGDACRRAQRRHHQTDTLCMHTSLPAEELATVLKNKTSHHLFVCRKQMNLLSESDTLRSIQRLSYHLKPPLYHMDLTHKQYWQYWLLRPHLLTLLNESVIEHGAILIAYKCKLLHS